jgi:predicted DsbA family dithiol-disulfide isomerase
MPKHLKIDFVSDVSCPWCVIGLRALQQAIARLGDAVTVELHLQPFELNPQMPAGGQAIDEHLREKYGSTPEQSAQVRERIRAAGAELGFSFGLQQRSRIYNTFDAHRLLRWAALQGCQLQLKQALFKAYFSDGEDPSNHVVLIRLAQEAGLDSAHAARILAGDEYAAEVRQAEDFYQANGIHAVPAVIINDRQLIQGGQPVAVFEQALREIANSA